MEALTAMNQTQRRLSVQNSVNTHKAWLQDMAILDGMKTGQFDSSWVSVLKVFRGEQPNNPAVPVDGAMSGDVPRSYPSESEVL